MENERGKLIGYYVYQSPTKTLCLPYESILFMESEGHMLHIYTNDANGHYRIRQSLDQATDELPGDCFVRCHRGYIVNVAFVCSVQNGMILLSNNQTVPIGRAWKANFAAGLNVFCETRKEIREE